jgi:hypothetical protein
MISQFQFNNVLKELNASFSALAARVEKLEKKEAGSNVKTTKGKSKG